MGEWEAHGRDGQHPRGFCWSGGALGILLGLQGTLGRVRELPSVCSTYWVLLPWDRVGPKSSTEIRSQGVGTMHGHLFSQCL